MICFYDEECKLLDRHLAYVLSDDSFNILSIRNVYKCLVCSKNCSCLRRRRRELLFAVCDSSKAFWHTLLPREPNPLIDIDLVTLLEHATSPNDVSGQSLLPSSNCLFFATFFQLLMLLERYITLVLVKRLMRKISKLNF